MNFDQEINRARSAAIKNKPKLSRAILRKVIEKQPRNVEAWLLFAEVAQNQEDALRCLDRVLKIDPGNEAAAKKRAYLLPPSANEMRRRVQPEESAYDFHQRLGIEGEEGSEDGYEVVDDFQQSAADPGISAVPVDDEYGQGEKHNVWDYYQDLVPGQESADWREGGKPGNRLESVLRATLVAVAVLCIISLACVFLLPNILLPNGAGGEAAQAEEGYTSVVMENLRASNAEEIDAYMATIHSRSPLYEQTETSLFTIFRDYDLSYSLDKLELLKAKPTEVQLAFELTTSKLSGPSFRDNTVVGVMILRQEGGQWKIYDQQVDQIEYHN